MFDKWHSIEEFGVIQIVLYCLDLLIFISIVPGFYNPEAPRDCASSDTNRRNRVDDDFRCVSPIFWSRHLDHVPL